MTNHMATLRDLVEKTPDADLLREMIGFTAERLMELAVGAVAGALPLMHGLLAPHATKMLASG